MIVLDSSFLISFYNEGDAHHATARQLMDRFLAGTWGTGLLLEYVFLEIVTVLLVRRDLSVATRVGRILLDADEVEFVASSDLFAEAVENFSQQAGTGLNFTDAAIVAVARSRAAGMILSFDEEFCKLSHLQVNPK